AHRALRRRARLTLADHALRHVGADDRDLARPLPAAVGAVVEVRVLGELEEAGVLDEVGEQPLLLRERPVLLPEALPVLLLLVLALGLAGHLLVLQELLDLLLHLRAFLADLGLGLLLLLVLLLGLVVLRSLEGAVLPE